MNDFHMEDLHENITKPFNLEMKLMSDCDLTNLMSAVNWSKGNL